MLFVPDLVWKNNEALGGKRWSLVENKPTPAVTTPGQPQLPPQPGNFQPGRPGQGTVQGRPQGNPQIIFGN